MSSDSTEPLPPYSYVPGGPWPHPISAPAGHSFGRPASKANPIADSRGPGACQFVRGVELFNEGYYWEAHEVWEGLWHAHGRRGPTADVLKGLIKLAAAGVKAREGQEHGVRTHAHRACESLTAARDAGGAGPLGLDLDAVIGHARALAHHPPAHRGLPESPVVRVFGFRLEVAD